MEKVIKKIKAKKELSDLPDSIVNSVLKDYLSKNKIIVPKEEKQIKIIIKEIRSELRKYTGRFQKKYSFEKKLKFLKENKIKELLKTHTSTKERLSNYVFLKNLIKKFNNGSILDLGSGLNPIALNKKASKYFAYDIKGDDLKLVKYFFKQNKINGKTFLKDITRVKKFPKTNLCLILKTLDIIESKKHKKAKEILEKLNSEILIASFSTKTLSGKKMSHVRRKWFENLAKSLNKNFKIIIKESEVFYIVYMKSEL